MDDCYYLVNPAIDGSANHELNINGFEEIRVCNWDYDLLNHAPDRFSRNDSNKGDEFVVDRD